MPRKNPSTVPCMYPGCKTMSYARGLCGTHYNGAQRRIRRNVTTWDELEAIGLAMKPEKEVGGFDQVLEERRQKVVTGSRHE